MAYIGQLQNGSLLTSNGTNNAELPVSTDGFVLTANSSAPNGIDWEAASTPAPTPNSTISIIEEFVGDGSFGSKFQGNFTWGNWGNSATFTTTGFNTTKAVDISHPGILASQQLITTTANIASLFLGDTSTGSPNTDFLLGGGILTINWVFNIATLSTVTNTYTLRLGLGDTMGAAQANGVYFQYTNGTNSGNWQIITASASTRTTTNTTIAATTGWHKFQIVVNAAASSVTFTLDGVAQTAITTNIPTANSVNPCFDVAWSAGTVPAGALIVDLMYLFQTLTTPR